MTITHGTEPSEEGKVALDALQKAVDAALDKKNKLGQYAVLWDGNKPVLKGDDAPPEE